MGCTGYSSTKPASAGKEFKNSGQKDAAQQDRAGSLLQTVWVLACLHQPVSQLHALCSPARGAQPWSEWQPGDHSHVTAPALCTSSSPRSCSRFPLSAPTAPGTKKLHHAFCALSAWHSQCHGVTCHLQSRWTNAIWEKMSRAGRHSSPDKMAQPCSWTESQGGRAAREPQHQFPLNSQKSRVCYVLQKPHLINLLCTPALWWEFYSVC